MARIPLKLEELIDGEALRRDLIALTAAPDSKPPAVRAKALKLLKAALASGRQTAEKMLVEDGGGTACAARLSHLMDEVIRALYDFAVANIHRSKNPSSGERMAVVAVGGYGRGTLAPGSDIDLLFLLPSKQTPWGEQVGRIHALHALGPGAEGRPRHPQHRRMRAPVALRHHHPHLYPRSALRMGRCRRCSTN